MSTMSGMHAAAAAAAASYNAGDYSTALSSLSTPASAAMQHQLLQDTYKSMAVSAPSVVHHGVHHQQFGGQLHHHQMAGGPVSVAQVPSPRSSRRYTGRATCDCPNCQEADRLGPAGAHLRKRNIHSFHIPGCGKVYGKTSHLKVISPLILT